MHNLYFPWIRIILFIGIGVGAIYSTQFFNPKEIQLEFTEEDLSAYESKREILNSNIQYFVNGENRRYGNLVGIEPHFLPMDFYSKENFLKAIEPLMEKARQEGALDSRTLVLFPEHVGTGLVLLGEKRPVFVGESWKDSLDFFLSESQYKPESSISQEDENFRQKRLQELFITKREEILSVYHETFSYLAKKYKVSINAGSIVLPEPKVYRGKITTEEGTLFNTSFTYLANGNPIDKMIKKVNLSEWEKGWIESGGMKQEFIIKVPAWRVSVLLGEDSLYDSVYTAIRGQKMDGVISPSSGFTVPNWDELGKDAKGKKTEDLWIQYGVNSRQGATMGKDNLQIFWKGEAWGLKITGESYTNRGGKNLQRSGQKDAPKVLNLYF